MNSMSDEDASADDDGVLDEYLAAIAKVDDAVATLSARAGDALRCTRGCSSCCADDLALLPVEAERVARVLEVVEVQPRAVGACVFLDDDGACQIYLARPMVCRTHGLALRLRDGDTSRPVLRILDDVHACELNYRDRAPAAAEVLDGDALLRLLLVVNQRFCDAAGLDDDDAVQRIPMRDLLD